MTEKNYTPSQGVIKPTFLCLLLIVLSVQILTAQNDISRAMSSGTDVVRKGKTTVQSTLPPINLAPQTPSFTEGFDGGVVPAGWSIQNRSATIGTNTNCWNIFDNITPWASQAGAGQIGANFNCTAGAGTISGWLISPVINFNNGDTISFWTRKSAPDSFADRLEVRLSTAGTSTNVGTTATSVGDFTTVLVSVNPTLTTGVYPIVYTQFTATISGLAAPTNGRVAFRYFVTNGGPDGANSDILSIDTFNYSLAPTAAGVTVNGRVLSSTGRAVSRAKVQIIDQNGNSRIAMTNGFGYYNFTDVPAGEVLIFNVAAKNYLFAPQVVNLTDNLAELNFTAQ